MTENELRARGGYTPEGFAEFVSKAPLEDLVDFAQDLRAEATAAIEKANQIERVVVERMQADGATMLDCPRFESVKLEPKIDVDIRISELLPLRTIIKPGSAAAKILEKALKQVTPAPRWDTNMTYLNQLGKLGGAIAKCIQKGVVKVPNGYRLVVKQKRTPVVHIPEGPS